MTGNGYERSSQPYPLHVWIASTFGLQSADVRSLGRFVGLDPRTGSAWPVVLKTGFNPKAKSAVNPASFALLLKSTDVSDNLLYHWCSQRSG
jgi:hypothetical protein